MAVEVMHAVANEFGTTTGGAIGDQDNEIRFAKWYAKNSKGATWALHIRPRDPEMAERAAEMAETVVLNQGIGYGQESELRNTIYDEAIKAGGDLSRIRATCDCSSMILTIFALLIPGFPHTGSTATMFDIFPRYPQYFALSKDEQMLGSDLRARRGDIYLRKGHVLMVRTNGRLADTEPVVITPSVPAPSPASGKNRIIMDGIKKWCNVRSGPGTENPKIGVAKVNEIFERLGVEEEWYHIDFHGRDGWVYYEFASEMLEGNI